MSDQVGNPNWWFSHPMVQITNQRTIGPENAHLKPDLGVLSHHEMTLTLNTHTPLLTSQVVCICSFRSQAAIVSKPSDNFNFDI